MNHGQSQCFLQVCFSNNCHLGLWMNHHFLQYTQNGGFSTSMFSYEGMDWFQQVLESLISWLTSFSPRLWLSNPGISSHNMTGYCICSTAKTCQCLDSYWTLQDIAHGKRSAWKLKRNWSFGRKDVNSLSSELRFVAVSDKITLHEMKWNATSQNSPIPGRRNYCTKAQWMEIPSSWIMIIPNTYIKRHKGYSIYPVGRKPIGNRSLEKRPKPESWDLAREGAAGVQDVHSQETYHFPEFLSMVLEEKQSKTIRYRSGMLEGNTRCWNFELKALRAWCTIIVQLLEAVIVNTACADKSI